MHLLNFRTFYLYERVATKKLALIMWFSFCCSCSCNFCFILPKLFFIILVAKISQCTLIKENLEIKIKLRTYKYS